MIHYPPLADEESEKMSKTDIRAGGAALTLATR